MKFLSVLDNASMIKQDPKNRFVSDTQIAAWDSASGGVDNAIVDVVGGVIDLTAGTYFRAEIDTDTTISITGYTVGTVSDITIELLVNGGVVSWADDIVWQGDPVIGYDMFNLIKLATFDGVLYYNTSTITKHDNYVLAKDSDFDENNKYIGSDLYVEIPPTIRGVPLTSYYQMFMGTAVRGVKSLNKNITEMRSMFNGATSQTLDISQLDTSNVDNMNYMFADAQCLSLDVSSMDTSNATGMFRMFSGCEVEALDLSTWDTSRVTDMRYMFEHCKAKTINLKNLNTSNVTNMRSMFESCLVESLDLSSFDTSKVVSPTYTASDNGMCYMFEDCRATYIDLTTFNTEGLTNLWRMFYKSRVEVLDLSSFNLRRLDISDDRNYFWVFRECSATVGYARTSVDMDKLNAITTASKPAALVFDVKPVNVGDEHFVGSSNGNFKYIGNYEAVSIPSTIGGVSITSCAGMFEDSAVTYVSSGGVSITDTSNMFKGATGTTIDLSNFDMSNVTTTSGMFDGALVGSVDFGVDTPTTTSISDMSNMYRNTIIKASDMRMFDIQPGTIVVDMFDGSDVRMVYTSSESNSLIVGASSGLPTNTLVEVVPINITHESDFKMVGSQLKYTGTSPTVSIPAIYKGKLITSYYELFYNTNVNNVTCNSQFITNMRGMFQNNGSTSPFILINFTTENTTDMAHMFRDTKHKGTIDLSTFDMGSVTNTGWMFRFSRFTSGLARTQADADILNASSAKPSGLIFTVKP